MSQAAELDLQAIRNPKKKDVAAYFRKLLQQNSAVSICKALLSAVEAEQLTALVFSIFLPCAKSLECIVACLYQSKSKQTRKTGIKHYGKALADADQWRAAWSAMGGAEGLTAFMSTLSLQDVKYLIAVIGSCNRGQVRAQERDEVIEELFESLSYPEATEVSKGAVDARPLHDYYDGLVPACSASYVHDWLNPEDQSGVDEVPLRPLLRSHSTMTQETVEAAFYKGAMSGHDSSLLQRAFSEFIFRTPSGKGDEPKFTASMSFSLRVFQWHLKHPDNKAWPHGVSDISVYASLFNRCQKKRVKEKRWQEIVALGLKLLAQRPKSKGDTIFTELWALITKRWIKRPEIWEDVLVVSLRLGLGGSENKIGAGFVRFPKGDLDKARKWELFRLYNLHVPKNGVDVNVTENIKKLAKKEWPREVFDQFETEQAIKLLKVLISANPNYLFLPAPPGHTILNAQHVGGQNNFNAQLLLWHFQQGSTEKRDREEAREATKAAAAELQRKSAASREQADRAEFASAACFVAIASGSLDLYAEIVTWIQRFVRDPLTVKTLFNSRAVETIEGINLLSGIAAPQASMELDLAEMSVRVAKANSILQTFHQHMRLAKREPSFYKPDWQAIHSLFGQVMNTRITLAQSAQKTLRATDGDMYSAVWSQSFAVLSEIGIDSLQRAEYGVRNLITNLSAEVLLTTTRGLLETDDVYRAKAKDGEAGDESRVIERLAYHGLIKLAKSDKPSLARELIIRTIIDRPDASSWHRRLLTLGYLKTLPAREAEGMVLAFANAIGEKLQEQSYVRVGEGPGKPPIVKVSTVKYLAQLLEGADFVSADTTIDVLVELFKSAHPDVRFATFESLMSSLLGQASSASQFDVNTHKAQDPMMEKILTALESIIPVAGSINERRPPQPQDWREAEADPSKLPEVHPNLTNIYSLPPLLEGVLSVVTSRMSTPALANLRRVFLHRVVLPIVARCASEHDRWARLFWRKHCVQLAGDSVDPKLTSITLTPAVSVRMLQAFSHLLPRAELQRLNEYSRFLLTAPPTIISVNQKLKNDASKRSQQDVQHWLAVFDSTAEETLQIVTYPLIDLLRGVLKESELTGDKGIKPVHYQQIILAHMLILLADYDKHVGAWKSVINRLRPPTFSDTCETWRRWRSDCAPLLEKIADTVESKRTPDWLEDPGRKPAILPHTARIRVWLHAAPYLDRETTGKKLDESLYTALTGEIVGFVHTQLATDIQRTNRLVSDIASLKPCLSQAEQNTLGCHIGEASSKGSIRAAAEDEALVLVEAAVQLIDDVNKALHETRDGVEGQKPGKQEGHARRVRSLVQLWLQSEFESVREVAVDFGAKNGKPSRRQDE